jgi:hypothetical protein
MIGGCIASHRTILAKKVDTTKRATTKARRHSVTVVRIFRYGWTMLSLKSRKLLAFAPAGDFRRNYLHDERVNKISKLAQTALGEL